MSPRTATPIDHARVDREVGARVRARREALRLSQTDLGKACGVSFQQIQKYERGSNRISASALVAIAGALSVPAWALLEGVEREDSNNAVSWAMSPHGQQAYAAFSGLRADAFQAVLNVAHIVNAYDAQKAPRQ